MGDLTELKLPFWIRSPFLKSVTSNNHWKERNLKGDMFNLSVSTVPADDLALLGARSSADKVMSKFWSYIWYWVKLLDSYGLYMTALHKVVTRSVKALGRHFLLRVQGPHHLNFQGPAQNLKGPSIEIHYKFSNLGGSIGPSAKISQGPHWIFRGPGPLPPGPREPCQFTMNLIQILNYTLTLK